MKTKKIIPLFLFFILLINLVSAERLVNYNLKEGRIDRNGNFQATNNFVDDVNVIGFSCLDKNCENLGERIFDNIVLNSGSDSLIQLFYPDNLLSNYGYGVYYYKYGYIPWESNPNWFGTDQSDPQGPFNVYLSKKDVCSSQIEEFNILNSKRQNTPVVISVKADIDVETAAAINNAGPLKAIPNELKEFYSVNTLVSLSILKDNKKIYSNQKEELISFSEEKTFEFSFTPKDAGEYKAVVTTKVTDEKCSASNVNSEEKEFIILKENPENMCYTKFGNLESEDRVKAGDILTLSFNKISNLQLNDEDVNAIETKVNVDLVRESDNNVIFSEENLLSRNENSVDTQKYSLIINIPDFVEPGFYNLVLTGYGNNEMCGFDNKEDTIIKKIFVEKGGIFGDAPKIISQPVKTAILDENYNYDVEAVDPNFDELNYFLLFGPEGMNIDNNNGLITWFVDSNKFSEGQSHNVLLFVSDGLFFDIQFFSVKIESKIEEKVKKHDFKITGLDLETSNTKEGIHGFLQLKNNGNFKENKVSVSLDIYDLDIHELLTSNINLGKEDSFWIPIDIRIPSNVNEGEYLISVKLENTKHSEEQLIPVFIENNKEKVIIVKI